MTELLTFEGVVTYENRGPAAWITIERPEARNALNHAVREGLRAAYEHAAADDTAKVVVLTGSGEKAFCAGGDLKEMSDTALKVPAPDWIPQPGRTMDLGKPLIAAVNGVALAGGFLLAQCADLVVAAEHATFGITEARVGRGAPWAAPLPWLVPPRIALEFLLTAAPLPAERCREVGLVNHVVPASDLVSHVQDLAETIARNAPLSVAAGKRMVYEMASHPRERAFEVAEEIWEPVYLSDDAQEGPLSFKEKRAPRWSGR